MSYLTNKSKTARSIGYSLANLLYHSQSEYFFFYNTPAWRSHWRARRAAKLSPRALPPDEPKKNIKRKSFLCTRHRMKRRKEKFRNIEKERIATGEGWRKKGGDPAFERPTSRERVHCGLSVSPPFSLTQDVFLFSDRSRTRLAVKLSRHNRGHALSSAASYIPFILPS